MTSEVGNVFLCMLGAFVLFLPELPTPTPDLCSLLGCLLPGFFPRFPVYNGTCPGAVIYLSTLLVFFRVDVLSFCVVRFVKIFLSGSFWPWCPVNTKHK